MMSTATNVTTKPYIVRLRERGQITLPAQLREELGVGVGDFFTIVKVDSYVVMTPKRLVVSEVTGQLEQLLAEKGLTLDDLLSGLEDERARLFEERYGQLVSS
jgi:bifunctional DNA-binding transcriptional regulator/antitoxin component of YhaV-PrlF toxin-antitoxin module